MQLSSIKAYLEKYTATLTSEEDKRGVLIAIIKEEVGIVVEQKMLSLAKGILKLKVSPIVKNEIFLHKEQLLQKFKTHGRTDIFDIQ